MEEILQSPSIIKAETELKGFLLTLNLLGCLKGKIVVELEPAGFDRSVRKGIFRQKSSRDERPLY